MARYQIKLAYDGTLFQGYQRQQHKTTTSRTVQGVVEEALRQLGWQGASILSSGRTDQGVHAAGQVAAFDLQWNHSPNDLLNALNAHLPDEVAVSDVRLAMPDFHPRYAAKARHYRYHIYCSAIRDPLQDRYSWRVWPPVALAPLQEIASKFIGTHDFGAFGTPPRRAGSTIRNVVRSEWQLQHGNLFFDIVANAFLYHMVRRLVYAQVVFAQGKISSEQIDACLDKPSLNVVQGLAPPQGLVLMEVIFK